MIYPVHLTSGTNFISDKIKEEKYRRIYARSSTNDLQYVTGLIRNMVGEILVIYNKQHQSRQIPSGKIDLGEDQLSALKRELYEELGIEVVGSQYIGSSKKIFHNMPWEGHFFNVQSTGEIVNKEGDTIGEIKRVSIVATSTWLGFGISYNNTVITDPSAILEKRHMFAEVRWLTTKPNYQPLMSQRIHLPSQIDPHEAYIQYRDDTDKQLHIDSYQNYLHQSSIQ